MAELQKFFPRPTVETKEFWEGCRKKELLIQFCPKCGNHQFYPRIHCTQCMCREVEWVKSSGIGHVSSYTIVHRAISKAYAEEVPYVVALIELDEGVTMMSNIIGCLPQDVTIGMKVKVIFEEWSDQITIPKFSPL